MLCLTFPEAVLCEALVKVYFYFQCVHVLIKILLEIKMQKARQISRAVPCAAGGTGELPKPMPVFVPAQRDEPRAD